MSHVAWSLCLSVCVRLNLTDVLWKNGWTDLDAVWRAYACEPKELCTRRRSRSPTRMDNFGGRLAHWKTLGVFAAVYAAKTDHSILNNGTTAVLLQPTVLQCSQLVGVIIILSTWKITPCDAVFHLKSLTICFTFITYYYGGATGKALDLRSTGRGFNSYSGQKLRNNLGQVVPTYVPLWPISITWFWSRGDDALRLGR